MHERSLVESLLEQVERYAAGAAVEEVRLTLGPLAGVERSLLEDAYAQLAPGTAAAAARLVIDEVPLRAGCEACRGEFAPVRFDFVCPHCGSGRTRVLAGDALVLQSLTVVRAGGGD